MQTPSAMAEAAVPATIDPAATGGFGIRFAGRAIDWVVTAVLGLIAGVVGGIGLGVAARFGYVHGDWLAKMQAASVWSGLGWGLLAAFVYHSIAEGVGGTTIGKLVLGFRVVQTDLRPCGFVSAMKRSAAFVIDSLFFGIPAYSAMQKGPLQQRLGDQFADTVVVKGASLPASARRPGGLVAMGILCGMVGHGVVMVISVVAKVL
jgi:uncharacterized RDD family membrane protein YckC